MNGIDKIELDTSFELSNNIFYDEQELQTPETIKKQILIKKRAEKTKVKNMMKRETLADILKELPEENEYLHLISNGLYDFFTFIPVLTDYLGGASEFYGSTWTMNRNNVEIIMQLYDKKKIKKVTILTGVYFKQRESAVYAQLVDGLISRGQRFKCFENHSKITLLTNNKKYIVVEGSANFTSNPRVEQYVITNNKEVYNFHKDWMEDIIANHKSEREYFKKRKK